MAQFTVIIDDREQAVIPLFNAFHTPQNTTYKVMRCTVGDYNIMYKGRVICSIERKTWKDLAASIKDGRKANTQKMIDLRTETGCMLFYLMEGGVFFKPTRRHGRIPYKNLRANLDHLIFRDNIHVIHSKNQSGTVARLFELCQNLMSIVPKSPLLTSIDSAIEAETPEETKERTLGGEALLKKKVVIPDAVINYAIWTCVPNITERTASMLIDKYHISDLILGKISKDEIRLLKYPSGHIIGKRSEKIWKASRAKKENDAVFAKMLSQIKGMTKATAIKVLDVISWEGLLKGEISIETIAAIQKSENRKLGKKMAEQIHKFFVLVRPAELSA